MRFRMTGNSRQLIGQLRGQLEVLGSARGKAELHRGVIDAGKRVQTQVQRAVAKQMAVAPGHYGGFVVKGTRGMSKPSALAFEIFGMEPGQKIERYKGLKSVKSGGRLAKTLNAGRSAGDFGTVRSGVWNKSRLFKRSFSSERGHFAFREGSEASGELPRAFWTFGGKPNQKRGTGGRFAPSGSKRAKVRPLFGPSLQKEIVKDDALEVFQREGPALLEREVTKRLIKLTRF